MGLEDICGGEGGGEGRKWKGKNFEAASRKDMKNYILLAHFKHIIALFDHLIDSFFILRYFNQQTDR